MNEHHLQHWKTHISNTAPGHARGVGVSEESVSRSPSWDHLWLSFSGKQKSVCVCVCGDCTHLGWNKSVPYCSVESKGCSEGETHLAQKDLPSADTLLGFKQGLLLNGGAMGWKTATLPWVNECACLCVCNNCGASFCHSAWQQLMMGDRFTTAQWALGLGNLREICSFGGIVR